jgi:hypothetical protein
MREREHRPAAKPHTVVGASARGRTEPPGTAARILRAQQVAGNGAVTSALAGRTAAAPAKTWAAIQRDTPTRAENIAALRGEVTAAQADPAKWKDVALRLNGFDKADFPAVCAEIPDGQLQAARSAVERHLPGWPAQAAILAALDARAKKAKVSLRPLGSSIWSAYSTVGYNVWSGEDQKNKVWEHIGGSIGRKFTGGNTCAARVSWAFNYGGFPIAGAGTPNDSGVTFKGKKGDGKTYIVWVPSLQSYLASRWGSPDASLADNAAATAFEAALAPGEVAVFAGPHHSGLIMQGYSDAYVKSDPGVMPVDVWKLPK